MTSDIPVAVSIISWYTLPSQNNCTGSSNINNTAMVGEHRHMLTKTNTSGDVSTCDKSITAQLLVYLTIKYFKTPR